MYHDTYDLEAGKRAKQGTEYMRSWAKQLMVWRPESYSSAILSLHQEALSHWVGSFCTHLFQLFISRMVCAEVWVRTCSNCHPFIDIVT